MLLQIAITLRMLPSTSPEIGCATKTIFAMTTSKIVLGHLDRKYHANPLMSNLAGRLKLPRRLLSNTQLLHPYFAGTMHSHRLQRRCVIRHLGTFALKIICYYQKDKADG